MSSKINVKEIIWGHINTLSDAQVRKSLWDLFTFFFVPALLAVAGAFLGFKLSDNAASLLVNFGAIFTALLLSVLVLVYEQENKIKLREKVDPLFSAKKTLLDQLYYNICYSVLASIFLVGLCFAASLIGKKVLKLLVCESFYSIDVSMYFLSPLVIFVTVNLMLTIVMIVKRMHAMLSL